MNFWLFMIDCILCNNFIFSRFLGNCPFLGVSSKVETATGMGLAVVFVMALASFFTYLGYYYILVPFNLQYLETILF
ncbi:MAG TPA: electron transport complex subunit RsxA, partial [Candidatus Aphodomonas merdavium]|nr:electron transport complex subunit RsxA [Candidatus Aphodomonas merdavium]